jgi:hypothetical protein
MVLFIYLEMIVMMMMCLKRCDKIMLQYGRRILYIILHEMNVSWLRLICVRCMYICRLEY